MFNKRIFIAAINKALSVLHKPKPGMERLRVTLFQGVGSKKGMMSYHRDILRQKRSRYPKVHQGAQECARRRG